MTLSQFGSKLYALANILGDVQAVAHKKPAKAIPKRIGRRIINGYQVAQEQRERG